MPDGPRYDDDFYAWTQHQAEVLRTMRRVDNRLDREKMVVTRITPTRRSTAQ